MRELEVKHFELMMDTNQDEFDYQVVLVPLLNSIVLWKRAARQRGHVSERERGHGECVREGQQDSNQYTADYEQTGARVIMTDT